MGFFCIYLIIVCVLTANNISLIIISTSFICINHPFTTLQRGFLNLVIMVKNYRGIEVVKKVDKQQLLVKDYMATRLIKFKPDQSIFEAMNLLLSKKISGAPVVNDQNELVGMISESDCMKEVIRGKYHNMPIDTGSISSYMTEEVVYIAPDLNIFEVAQLFLEKELRRFPVVFKGKLVGQISQKDVIRAFKKVRSSTWR